MAMLQSPESREKIYLQPDYLLKMNPSYMKYTSELFGV